MRKKKRVFQVVSVLVVLVGVGCILFSNYIMQQVNEGKLQVASGQQKVDTGKQLFSMNPVAKELGKGLTNSAQRKIDAGKETIAQYESLASTLKTAGVIAIVAGGIGVFYTVVTRKR